MRRLGRAATLVALFIGALLASVRMGGTSPIIWIDTFNDELEIQRCLVDDSCTMTGMATSVPGLAHAVAWLELRALLAWLGVGLDGAHMAMIVSNALAVVLVFHLATQLAGPIAGTAAAWLAIDHIEQFARPAGLNTTSLLLFLGAVLVLVSTAAILRPGFASVALVALLSALMANIHIACIIVAPAVILIALLAPRRRLLLAAFGGLLFAFATFAIAPPSWLHNIDSLLQNRGSRGHLVTGGVTSHPLTDLAIFAVAAWVASLAVRTPAAAAYRRHALGALAVLVPAMVLFLMAPRFGLNPEAKYIYQLKAASAVAAALPIGASLAAFVPVRLQWMLPIALALAMAWPTGLAARARVAADDERTPTVADTAMVAKLLERELGWTASAMLRNLRTPYGLTFLTGLQQMAKSEPAPAAPTTHVDSAVLLMLDHAALPDPLPAHWRVLRRTSQAQTVLILLRSRIDWRNLLVCTEPADGSPQRCNEWNWEPREQVFIAPMPPGGVGWRGTLRVTFGVRPAQQGFVDEIFMPRMPFVCGGRVRAIPDGVASADQRHATITGSSSESPAPPVVTFEWELGSPECDDLAYDGMVPFFIEGEAESIRSIVTALERQESIR